MIEIIALIFLCKKMGNLAIQKGLKPGTWKIYTLLAWFVAEILGMILAVAIFGQDIIKPENLISVMALALISAYGGYLFIKSVLDKKPDSFEEDINSIGVDDLHPPHK